MTSQSSHAVAERTQRLLQPGERIGRVIVAQGGISPRAALWIVVAGLAAGQGLALAAGGGGQGPLGGFVGMMVSGVVVVCLTTRRVLAETDRNVVVLKYGRFGGVKPTRVITRLPRSTAIGPFAGTWTRTTLAGERLWVHRKWYGDAASFDARLG
ncbi:hypothetical protein [Streptomyces sp. NPDC018610]|jgi:hypothetical protein|uniref:hypothetical protein n=1 Tax=Streptomyces sp. NPDC018610 TaxID=3365049 RepID=UPI0037A45F13